MTPPLTADPSALVRYSHGYNTWLDSAQRFLRKSEEIETADPFQEGSGTWGGRKSIESSCL
jgi:hypothetical protein